MSICFETLLSKAGGRSGLHVGEKPACGSYYLHLGAQIPKGVT